MTQNTHHPDHLSATHHPTVTVIYNGLDKTFSYEPHASVESLLVHARKEFAIHQNPHLLGLYAEDGRELKDAESLESAGVHPDSRLLLRPSAVRGGCYP